MSRKSKRLVCPECKSSRIWKDGIRHTRNGEVQRYICRSCGLRFSEPTTNSQVKLNIAGQILKEPNSGKNFPEADVLQRDLSLQPSVENLPFQSGEDVGSHRRSKVTIVEKGLNRFRDYNSDCRVSASRKGAKNLVEVKSRTEKWAAGATEQTADVKGKILEFLWKLKKQGYSEATIKTYGEALNTIIHRGANVFNTESVKETLAKEKFSDSSKHIIIAAYSKFLETQGGTWKPPICRVSRKLPFIPLEREIDDLIAGCGKKAALFLQVLKETAMRAGEALRLKWTDIDFKRRIMILNEPEKHGNPRVFQISPKLIEMLNALPKKSHKVFDCTYISVKSNYVKSRKRLARKLGNPRLQRITFHTLRHWKATMTYHKTKDPLYVKEMLGHKSLNTTLLYIQLEKTLYKESSDEFTVKVAKEHEMIKALLEVGFEYVCEKDGLMFFRKRK